MFRFPLPTRWLMVFALVIFVGSASAGLLEPPAAPAPTMKTLDEAAPGTPIRQSDVPRNISEPGHYYLVENVTHTGAGPAIGINAQHVTLDLGGFVIDGVDRTASTSRRGITVNQPQAVIRNGSITNMGGGGIVGAGAIIEDMRITACLSVGIDCPESTVRRCTVRDILRNTDTGAPVVGIRVSTNGIVEDSRVSHINASDGAGDIIGITAVSGSAIRRNMVRAINSVPGNDKSYTVYGIKTDGAGFVEDCHVETINAGPTSLGAIGIHTDSNTVIRGNDVKDVTSDVHSIGIRAGFGAVASNNHLGNIGRPTGDDTVTGIWLGERAHAIGNTIRIVRNTPGADTMRGILMNGRAEAHDNSLYIDGRFSSSHVVHGIAVEGIRARIVQNRIIVEADPSATRVSILFAPTATGGFAGANICSGPIDDLGSNTLGIGNFANQGY